MSQLSTNEPTFALRMSQFSTNEPTVVFSEKLTFDYTISHAISVLIYIFLLRVTKVRNATLVTPLFHNFIYSVEYLVRSLDLCFDLNIDRIRAEGHYLISTKLN